MLPSCNRFYANRVDGRREGETAQLAGLVIVQFTLSIQGRLCGFLLLRLSIGIAKVAMRKHYTILVSRCFNPELIRLCPRHSFMKGRKNKGEPRMVSARAHDVICVNKASRQLAAILMPDTDLNLLEFRIMPHHSEDQPVG